MKYVKLLWREARNAAFVLAGWLAVHGTALAALQQEEKKAEGGGGSYVLPYALVILGIALGLLVVCRPSHRRDRAKPEQYDEKNLLKEKE
jgi:hypothetical protein